jgi:aerobic-type carbon monoxide dehydrogenase small subunit (CoxS/CutS family)
MDEVEGVESTTGRITRRTFIKSVIAAGAASWAGYMVKPLAFAGQSLSARSIERLITLNVNGRLRHVDVMPRETLAFTLRNKLGLTGTKIGCDRGECGACTVLIDDIPRYSCSTLTHSARGKKIVTIEGLSLPGGKLHPLQRGVLDEMGFQCGFCAPGFLMAAAGFLKTNPNPTRGELARGVSGNLCRCQDYEKILDSLLRGAKYMGES